MYRLLVLLHVLGVFGFLMSHGISVGVAFTLRRERELERIRALLNLSSSSLGAFKGGCSMFDVVSVLGGVFMNLSDFRIAQQPAGHVTAPQPDTPAYGKYLVDILGCRDCHGDQLQGKIEDGQPGPPPGPNLTQVVPGWTEEEFIVFFSTGTLPGGGQVPILTLKSGFSEPRMPWSAVRAATTDDELRAMFSYLHALPPLASPAR